MGASSRRVTSVDVATEAGVSQATVARVFASPQLVAASTKARVLAVAERLGYVPNAIARSLKSQRTNMFGAVVPAAGEYWQGVVTAFSSQLAAQGRQLLLFSFSDPSEVDSALRSLAQYRLDGVILASSTISQAQFARALRSDLPLVAFNQPDAASVIPSVSIDNEAGMRVLADHLIDKRCNSALFVGGVAGASTDQMRYRGAASQLGHHGVACPYLEAGAFSYKAGHDCVERILARSTLPDAVMVSSDEVALGIIDGFKSAGVRVPDDVLLTGFDGLPQASWAGYDLTTISQPIDLLVERALNLLLATKHAEAEPPSIVVDGVPRFGASTRPPTNNGNRGHINASVDGDVVVQRSAMARRVIEPAAFRADTEAFVDVRIPRSVGKASYSLIGGGVSQNPDQTVNLAEPHGFHIGAASMRHGVVNNQHLHYTAEVFICTRGDWRFHFGERSNQHFDIGPRTVLSAPTWVFRGFENIGADDGWLFTVLGGDETGGIIWAPEVLREAAATGMYLRSDNSLADVTKGDSIDGRDDLIKPLSQEQLRYLDSYSDTELAERAVQFGDLDWSATALLSSVLPGHSTQLAPVIGFGLSEDRRQHAPIATPHGFSLEWLRVELGSSTGLHRHHHKQAVLLCEGSWQIQVNRDRHAVTHMPAEGSVVSIPPGAWRSFTNIGSRVGHAVVVCATDLRPQIDWDPSIVEAAGSKGWGRDAAGYLAPLELLGGHTPSEPLTINP